MQPAGPQLLDIHLPAQPSFWPPAPGWWVLAGALLVVLGLVVVILRRMARRRAMRRLLEQELSRLEQAHPGPEQAAARIAGLSVLLRRMAAWNGSTASRLPGEDWLRFLDGEDPARPFSAGAGRVLLDAPYRPVVPEEVATALFALVRASLPRWLRAGHA
jgi:hypothetical protein